MEFQEKNQGCEQEVDVPRRNLLIGGGALAAGMLLTKAAGMLGTAEANAPGKAWPWPYEKVDPDRAAESAYHNWYQVFCSQAVTLSLMEQLREKVGEPWTSFPIEAIRFGMGGMLGWGLTCGAPLASALVIGLAIPKEVNAPMIHDLLQWYTDTSLPIYMAKKPNFQGQIPKTVAESPLCHLSVGKWMKEANRAFGSDERKHRCAGITASVAYRTAELMNQWKDGKYTPGKTWNGPAAVGLPAQENCMGCHGSNIPSPPMAAKK